jgi:hypothetical protein
LRKKLYRIFFKKSSFFQALQPQALQPQALQPQALQPQALQPQAQQLQALQPPHRCNESPHDRSELEMRK